MATAFASTTIIPAHNHGVPADCEALHEWTMPSSYPTGGIDLSTVETAAGFTEVTSVQQANTITGNLPAAYTWALTGTAGTYGVTVATAKLFMCYQTDPAAAGGANTELVQVTNTDDLTTTLTTCRVWVRGYIA